jgi:hypothetical protein
MTHLSETATLLFSKYESITLSSDQLAEVLHYGSSRALLNAISAERCPVHTFRAGKSRVADIRDVADYLDRARGL